MKKVRLFSLVLAGFFLLSGCGKVSQNTSDAQGANENNLKTKVITKSILVASTKIKLDVGETQSAIRTSALNEIYLTGQSIPIEADVPDYMTFGVNSDLHFTVQAPAVVEADGSINVNLIYNDLLGSDLQRVKVYACLDNEGLTGQTDGSKLIPMEIEVLNQTGYQRLSVGNVELKSWTPPFSNILNETLQLKLRGDFTNAFMQRYSGTITLQFYKDIYVEDTPDISIGLVAYYPFNGDALDYSGYNRNGNQSGVTMTTDRFGNENQAYYFNGNGSNISADGSGLPTREFTISMWMKPESTLEAGELLWWGSYAVNGLISLMYRSSIWTFNLGFYFNDLNMMLYDFDVNNWHLVTATYDGDARKIYVDGQLVANDNTTALNITDVGQLTIGAREQTYQGSMDDVRVYNRALSHAEVTTLYQLPN